MSFAFSSVISIGSSITFMILSAEASDLVIRRNTFDIIIRELSIRRT